MPEFTINTTGLPEYRRLLGAISPKLNPQIFRHALSEMGSLVQDKAKSNIRSGGGEPARGHLTSRSGDLRRSIFVKRQGLPVFVEVTSNDVASHVHETGVGRYPARPFMVPALLSESREFVGVLLKQVDRAMREAR